MTSSAERHPALTRLPDGTIKQVSPVTGTVVWTVPGRSRRPIASPPGRVEVLVPGDADRACAFCVDRYLETPPERTRLVVAGPGTDLPADAQLRGGARPQLETGLVALDPRWRVLRDLPAEDLRSTRAEFRRIPNLYPILTLDYWRADHGREAPESAVSRARGYVATPEGRAHLAALVRAQAAPAGAPDPTDDALVQQALGLFASAHDLVVARRHFVDGAVTDDQLCSSGDLAADEHAAFLLLTVDALRDLTESNPYARYVSVFQNWLRPAGASFDHLHKQLVAIDDWGPLMDRVVGLLRTRPGLFDEVLDHAVSERLVIAENEGAVAVAGVGHRYPTVELWSTAPGRPWEQDAAGVRAMSDLLHACHAATGPRVPTNEEWHYQPVSADVTMPWRINLKWRISTLAGFEGGTKINVNTIDPFTVRDRMVDGLRELRATGRVAGLRIGDECAHRTGILARGDRF